MKAGEGMMEQRALAAERIEQLMSKVRTLVPLAQFSLFKSPPELEFIGQGFFKIVFKYGGEAVKYYKFGRIKKQEREKLAVLSRLDTFEQLYMEGTRWTATEFIEGKKLKDIKAGLNKQAVEKVREDMLACLYLGWSPNDLHFGNFLVEPSGRIRFIDVDLFKDIRCYDKEKKARVQQRAIGRIEGLYQKMLGLVSED